MDYPILSRVNALNGRSGASDGVLVDHGFYSGFHHKNSQVLNFYQNNKVLVYLIKIANLSDFNQEL